MINYVQLDSFVEVHQCFEHFDEREHQGCTIEEIKTVENIISPYGQLPVVLREYLTYCGKWYSNLGQLYKNILSSNKYKQNQDLLSSNLFWVLEYSVESSVQCGFRVLDTHLDNPPYYTCETEVTEDFYLLFDHFMHEERIEQTFNRLLREEKYFRKNKPLFEIKQSLINLYSKLEVEKSSAEISKLIDLLRRLTASTYYAANTKNLKANFLSKIDNSLRNQLETYFSKTQCQDFFSRITPFAEAEEGDVS